MILGNLFAAAAGAIGLVLVGDGAEAPLSLVLLVPATLVTPFWAMATVNAPVLGRLVNTTGVACLLVVLVRLARVRPGHHVGIAAGYRSGHQEAPRLQPRR